MPVHGRLLSCQCPPVSVPCLRFALCNFQGFATSNRDKAPGASFMADLSKIDAFDLLGDADPVPQSLFLSHPEQAQTLALLYEVSREVTSILDREELLRRVAERIKKIVRYDVFSVMLWNEQSQHLESIFAMCCGSMMSRTIRVTFAAIPAWKPAPNSSCRFCCSTGSSEF